MDNFYSYRPMSDFDLVNVPSSGGHLGGEGGGNGPHYFGRQ